MAKKKIEDGRPLRGMFCCGQRPRVIEIDNALEITLAKLECMTCQTLFEIRETPARGTTRRRDHAEADRAD